MKSNLGTMSMPMLSADGSGGGGTDGDNGSIGGVGGNSGTDGNNGNDNAFHLEYPIQYETKSSLGICMATLFCKKYNIKHITLRYL